ncbi:MAG: inositol monophosphatase family protein, partial [Candidatus Norongarragalinales archaeon]
MERKIDWLPILIRCRDNVKEHIAPLLETARRQQQPNIGIGAGGDPIKQIDMAAEKAIVETIVGQGISFTLISEESGIREYGKNPKENYVTADPIDGTTNLTRGIPFYATSIAVSTKPELNTVHTALVADLSHGTTYTAEKGRGAHCNDKKIVPSKQTDLEDAV